MRKINAGDGLVEVRKVPILLYLPTHRKNDGGIDDILFDCFGFPLAYQIWFGEGGYKELRVLAWVDEKGYSYKRRLKYMEMGGWFALDGVTRGEYTIRVPHHTVMGPGDTGINVLASGEKFALIKGKTKSMPISKSIRLLPKRSEVSAMAVYYSSPVNDFDTYSQAWVTTECPDFGTISTPYFGGISEGDMRDNYFPSGMLYYWGYEPVDGKCYFMADSI